MSVAFQRVSNLVSLSISHLALNPAFTASLLFILTKGPVNLRARLTRRIAALRDPIRHAQIVKALKWLLALGLFKGVNKTLNHLALNSYRLRSEKQRWNWDREIAIVTGGCSGIGSLVVKRLIGRGITVVILDIQQLPPSLQGYAHIKFFSCDITDPAAVSSAAQDIKRTIGTPSILINNAGILDAHSILDTNHAYLQKIFAVNVFSNWLTVQAFLPDMIAANKGHIVTVASTASYVGVAGMADYTASKAAILSFHEALNQELKHTYNAPSILTTSIHPMWVRTPLIAPVADELAQRGAVIIEPEDVADAVVNQVLRCAGAQVFVPGSAGKVSLLRALPNWVQERVRSGVSQTIIESTRAAKE